MEVGIGRVAEGPIRIEYQAAVADVTGKDGTQRVALDIGVIGEHAIGGIDDKCSVFIDRIGVGCSHRDIIDRIDRQRDGDRVAVFGTVIDGVAKAVLAVEVGIGRVAEGPIRIEYQAAVADVTGKDGTQRVALDIGVIGEHAIGGIDDKRAIFTQRIGIG